MRTIYINGSIDADLAYSVRQQLTGLPPTEPLQISVNSDGGSVSAAAEIFVLLSAWRGPVTTEIVGWALSAASMIVMAGKRRIAHGSSLLMVHAPWFSSASGNAAALRESADALDQVAASMRAAYRRTGQPESVVASWLAGPDHWFTADQALAAGLITEIAAATEPAFAQHAFASCRFPVPQHVIERFRTMPTPTTPAAAQQQPALDAVAAATQAEFGRQREIRASFSRFLAQDGMAALQEQCLADVGCSAATANQRILAQMAKGVTSAAGHYIPRDHTRMDDFMAAATDVLLIRAGMSVKQPHPAVRDLQRTSVLGMAESICSMTGISTAGMSPSAVVKAAMTNSDFPLLLSNTANKSLLYGFDQAPQTHTAWTSSREVKDFKTNTLLVLSETPSLDLVTEASEYTFGRLSEAAETFAIGKYGKIIRLTREALINDDLSSFTTLPEKMGASARRLEADKVYARLTSNPTMSDSVALFHATHGNLAGVAAAPSVTSLGVARAAMRKQKGIGSLDFIDPQPRFLIVPVALETLCEQLLASLADPAKSNDTTNPAWIRGLTLVADPRLDVASATAWYLAASPQQIEGIARAYLSGETQPQVDTDEDFYTDTMNWKVRHEFAATVIGWRALYKNAGA